jgi:glutamate-ammonia-ligase adenylyltransferase
VSGSRTTLAGRLARLGFADAARAERLLLTDLGVDPDGTGSEPDADPLLIALAAAADPDLALIGLARMFGATDDRTALRQALRDEPEFRDRLTAVLGVSAGLADHLTRHPEDAQLLRGDLGRPSPAELREQMLLAVGASPRLAEPVAGQDAKEEPVAALAAAYRRRLLHLAARDMTAVVSVEEVVEELADIAAAVLEAALAVARSELAPGSVPCRLAVVAMGKCGARELNYASDVDVIFVAEPTGNGAGDETAALATASRLAAGLIRVCERSTPEGSHLPRRPEPPARGPPGPAGPHPGQPPGLLRPLGEDLGVPGVAQGPAGGGRRRPRPGATPTRRPAGLAGGAPRRTSSRTSRPCAAGWSQSLPARTWPGAS